MAQFTILILQVEYYSHKCQLVPLSGLLYKKLARHWMDIWGPQGPGPAGPWAVYLELCSNCLVVPRGLHRKSP